jgi:RimJ/RimL family protein N-acetyltransferase
LIVESKLPDGTMVLIWPLLPSDREAVREAYEHLSEESRHQRFLASVPHLTETMLDHLVDEVDGVDHVALALVAIGNDHVGVPTGVARMIRYPHDPTAADVAVTVADEWHGRGVATTLLAELMRVRPRGVARIVTTVSADNEASLAMLRRLGPTQVTSAGGSRLDVVVDLPPDNPEEPTGT